MHTKKRLNNYRYDSLFSIIISILCILENNHQKNVYSNGNIGKTN